MNKYKYELMAEVDKLDMAVRRCFADIMGVADITAPAIDSFANTFLRDLRMTGIEADGVCVHFGKAIQWSKYSDCPLDALKQSDCYKSVAEWSLPRMFKCDGCGEWCWRDVDDEESCRQTMCDKCARESIY